MESNIKDENEKYKSFKVFMRLSDKERILEINKIQQIKKLLEEISDYELRQDDLFELMDSIKKFEKEVSLKYKIVKNTSNLDREVESSKIKIGDEVKFGAYNNVPISWIVLDIQDRKALLLSKYCLLERAYNDKYEVVTWETCTLRKWLNQEFYKISFTEKEKTHIKTTILKNPENIRQRTKDEHDNKIFLLSIEEVEKYFSSDKERIAVMLNGSSAWWWLRSLGSYDNYYAAYVTNSGRVSKYGNYISYGNWAVRPALWVNLDSEIF